MYKIIIHMVRGTRAVAVTSSLPIYSRSFTSLLFLIGAIVATYTTVVEWVPYGHQQNRSICENKEDWNLGNIVAHTGFSEKNGRGGEDPLASSVCVFLYIFLQPQKIHRRPWNTADSSSL